MADFQGTPDDDTVFGTNESDTFHMEDDGLDQVAGKGDNDFFFFGAAFDNAGDEDHHDTVFGGDGYDILYLAGDYTQAVSFDADNLRYVEEIYLQGNVAGLPTTYDLRFAGLKDKNLYINGTTLSADDRLKVDAGSETTHFTIASGAADLTVTGGDGKLLVITSSTEAMSIEGGPKGDTFAWQLDGGRIGLVMAGGSPFNVDSVYDGRGGNDTLSLHGDLSGGVKFKPATIANIETIVLMPGFSYDLRLADANVATGARLTVDGGAISAAGSFFNFNGSGETDGSFTILGGFRGGVYKTGAGDDVVDLGGGGVNTVTPGAGADTVLGDSNTDIILIDDFFDTPDRLSGGGGLNDEIVFEGDYSTLVKFGTNTVTDFDIFTFVKGHDYDFRVSDGTVATGRTLVVDGSALRKKDSLDFDGSHETNGVFEFHGGAGRDTFRGGSGTATSGPNAGFGDQIHAGGGADKIYMGSGTVEHDLYYDGPASDSSSTHHDIVHQFDGTRDGLNVGASPSVSQVTAGTLSQATFDVDLATAMGANNAIAFIPDAGDLAGHHYLVVEKNAVSGYQADGDLVIEFVDPLNWATFQFFEL